MGTAGEPDDEALAASSEDAGRFEVVFELRAKEIWRYLASRLGAGAADELLSEVFLRAFAARARFDPMRGSARGWLFGIAHNLCREYARRQSRERLLAASAPVAAGGADELVRSRSAGAALGALPDERRVVVLLVAALGLSYEEAAQALGVPVGTIRSRYFRARRQLRALLDDEGSVDDGHQRIP
jgi:RNA polymerase sigma factor (sigma-70 family)